jgi:hypothetical protein
LSFGANYRSETDFLESTRWNFAYLVAVRFDLDSHGRLFELGIHHWSVVVLLVRLTTLSGWVFASA